MPIHKSLFYLKNILFSSVELTFNPSLPSEGILDTEMGKDVLKVFYFYF